MSWDAPLVRHKITPLQQYRYLLFCVFRHLIIADAKAHCYPQNHKALLLLCAKMLYQVPLPRGLHETVNMKQLPQNCCGRAKQEFTTRILIHSIHFLWKKTLTGLSLSLSLTEACVKLYPPNLPLIYHLLRFDLHFTNLGVIFLVMEIWQASTSKSSLTWGQF